MALPRPMRPLPNKAYEAERIAAKEAAEKKEEVLFLVEAMIRGSVDLSPEEMVDAAFLMVDKINDRIYGKEK